jgi:pSer/pThr/pTyr-binding forkhead associated (FHA) protein
MPIIFKVLSFNGQPTPEPMSMTFDRKGGTIGRSPESDFVLPDPNKFISRKHAVIFYENGCYYLKDTSMNGTCILNKSLHLHKNRVKLEDGDKIEIGDYEIIVILQSVDVLDRMPSVQDKKEDVFSLPDTIIVEKPQKEQKSEIPQDFDIDNLLSDTEEKVDELTIAPTIGTPLSQSGKRVIFTSYFPTEIKPDLWYTLLAYIHLEGAKNAVREDSETRLIKQSKDYRKRHGKATDTIARGTEIVVIPELPGCQFNPPRASVLWLEDWHRIEFRMQASEGLPGFEFNSAKNGKISFYVGPILVAEIKMWLCISDVGISIDGKHPKADSSADPYNAVFVSYSHTDKVIVQNLEKAYVALGMKYLRDIHILRSGEKWNPVLLKKIEEADIFQLCWSKAAKQSKYVEQEWRYALKLQRQSFIRPVYWETPMPGPPEALSDIHFAYLDVMLEAY